MSKTVDTEEVQIEETANDTPEMETDEGVYNIEFGKIYLFTNKRSKKDKFIGEPCQKTAAGIVFSVLSKGQIIGPKTVDLSKYTITEITRETAHPLSFNI